MNTIVFVKVFWARKKIQYYPLFIALIFFE